MSEPTTLPISADDIIHESRISPIQWAIITITLFAFLLDGFDIAVIAFTAPAISSEWGVASQQLGMVFSAGLLGMTLGAMFLAPLADIYGRRIISSVMLLLAGAATASVALTSTVPELIMMRLLAGLGLGTVVATLPTLAGEFCPNRHRALILAVIFSGVSVGPVIGGLIAAPVITDYGWRSLFLYAGALTIFVGVLVYIVIPESISFTIKRKPKGALDEVNRVLRYLKQECIKQLPSVTTDETQESASVVSLLIANRRRITLLIWATFFLAFMAVYFLISWIPQILSNAGFPQDQAILGSVVSTSGAVIGTTLYGWLARWRALNKIIAVVFTIGVAGLLLMSGLLYNIDSTPLWMIWCTLFLIGLTLMGGFVNLYIITLAVYPTQIRSTGLGWAIGLGRTGAVLSPLLAGLLISAGVSIPVLFLFFTVPTLAAATCVLLVKMEELS